MATERPLAITRPVTPSPSLYRTLGFASLSSPKVTSTLISLRSLLSTEIMPRCMPRFSCRILSTASSACLRLCASMSLSVMFWMACSCSGEKLFMSARIAQICNFIQTKYKNVVSTTIPPPLPGIRNTLPSDG
jgi:hypothetical protein